MNFDLSILYFIQEHLSNPFFDFFMPLVSFMGDKGLIWIIAGVALMSYNKTRRGGVMVIIAIALVFLIGELGIKNVVGRLRPFHVDESIQLLIDAPLSFSFPSGHTGSSFAASTVLMRYNKKMGIPALCLAACIAFSRMYLFVHYPTDILAGMVLGVAGGLTVYFLYNKYIPLKSKGNGVINEKP